MSAIVRAAPVDSAYRTANSTATRANVPPSNGTRMLL
jgi:hypothetical protein